ncbi:hypothetical protein EMCRGX_G008978 [Ephydatia muelleri]
MMTAISSGDFGRVAKLKTERNLTDNEKHVLLKKHFIPAASYKFPCHSINGQKRSFQHSWLSKYNGLVYSESQDGGYCKFCVLCGKCECSVNEFGVLVVGPFINFKKASEKLSKHFIHQTQKEKRFHQCAVTEATTFISVMECEALRIDNRINAERAQRGKENRFNIRSIVETVRRQGIAFRGHRDDCPDVQDDPNGNHGNFLALLNFRIQAGDRVLEEHLKNSASNALYTSKTVQNELIVICGDIIRNKILAKVRQAKYFSIIADEATDVATDVANDEQLSICICYGEEGLSVKLQGRYVDVVRAHNDVEVVKSAIKEAQSKVDRLHAKINRKAIAVAESVGVTESCPRISPVQLHCANPPADNISDCYKRILTIPMLDHLITELDMRFDKETSSIIVECIQLMPSEIVNSNTTISEPDFSNLLKLYGDDLPFSRGLDSEMDMWKQMSWTLQRRF